MRQIVLLAAAILLLTLSSAWSFNEYEDLSFEIEMLKKEKREIDQLIREKEKLLARMVRGLEEPEIYYQQREYVYNYIISKWWEITKLGMMPLPYEAEVELVYSPDGKLRFSHFNKLSGNSRFDNELTKAIDRAKRLGTSMPTSLETKLVFRHRDMIRQHPVNPHRRKR